jgi:hypothetical protein
MVISSDGCVCSGGSDSKERERAAAQGGIKKNGSRRFGANFP